MNRKYLIILQFINKYRPMDLICFFFLQILESDICHYYSQLLFDFVNVYILIIVRINLKSKLLSKQVKIVSNEENLYHIIHFIFFINSKKNQTKWTCFETTMAICSYSSLDSNWCFSEILFYGPHFFVDSKENNFIPSLFYSEKYSKFFKKSQCSSENSTKYSRVLMRNPHAFRSLNVSIWNLAIAMSSIEMLAHETTWFHCQNANLLYIIVWTNVSMNEII